MPGEGTGRITRTPCGAGGTRVLDLMLRGLILNKGKTSMLDFHFMNVIHRELLTSRTPLAWPKLTYEL